MKARLRSWTNAGLAIGSLKVSFSFITGLYEKTTPTTSISDSSAGNHSSSVKLADTFYSMHMEGQAENISPASIALSAMV
jgi:hypothetical protein